LIKDRHTGFLESLVTIIKDTSYSSRFRHAAGLVYKGRFLSIGVNQNKSHPFHAKFSHHSQAIFLHAETDAIKNLIKKYDDPDSLLKRSTLYIARVKYYEDRGKSMWGLSKPCIGCVKAILTFEIPMVVYSLDGDGYNVL